MTHAQETLAIAALVQSFTRAKIQDFKMEGSEDVRILKIYLTEITLEFVYPLHFLDAKTKAVGFIV